MNFHLTSEQVALIDAATSASREAERIIAEVCAKHGVAVDDVRGKSRRGVVVTARWEAICAVAKQFPKWSRKRISELFGYEDHTTVTTCLKRRGINIPPGRRGAAKLKPSKPVGKPRTPWTDEQTEILKTNWDICTDEQLAEMTGRGVEAIAQRRQMLGLRRQAALPRDCDDPKLEQRIRVAACDALLRALHREAARSGA
jgi:hypothetical protein